MAASAVSRRQSPSTPSRRTIALKRADGEPLTRSDIQYDVLYNIFRDTHDVFTDPYPPDVKPPPKICFRDLYLKYILHSPKATKALKDKMSDSQTFAEDFGMLALLVNVGRINTTMSCTPPVARLLAYTDLVDSFSRNENCDSNIPSHPSTSADHRQSSRRTAYQAHPEGEHP
jgi:Ino eighty subunit 1